MSIATQFFIGRFIRAFIVGIAFRALIAYILREDHVSIRGFVNTGGLFGIIYTGMWWIYLKTL